MYVTKRKKFKLSRVRYYFFYSPLLNFETKQFISVFLKNVIVIVAIKGLWEQVPREDDIQWSITFDHTCKFAVDFPLINMN